MKLSTKEFGKRNERGSVVLIHGTGAKAEMWNPQIKLLDDAGYHCIVPDLRGHGQTSEPGSAADIKAHLEDILETLEDYDLLYPATFVGHSLGAIISLELAAKKPELFEKILAVSMPGRVPKMTVEAFRVLLGWPYSAIKDSVIHRSLAWRERVLLDTNHYSLTQIVENFADLNYLDSLPEVACPVHFAVGRLDPVAPWTGVKKMHLALEGSTFELIEWAGHNCMDSQPTAFNKWFLAKMCG